MTNSENITDPVSDPGSEYEVGRRSITQRSTKSRFDMLREKQAEGRRGRPFIYGGIAILTALMAVLGYAFWDQFVAPPRALAIRVGEVEYTRGDVVDLIRFNQRLSEATGLPFQLGTSVFEALQTIQDAEIAAHLAPQYGISVSNEELDDRVEFLLGFAFLGEDTGTDEYQRNVEEAKRQFLNSVGIPERVWRDFLRKAMFQERLREVAGDNIPRIQPQVHVYQILLRENNPQTLTQIERELSAGTNTESVVREYSQDPNALRTRGDLGWSPRGVSPPLFDNLYFGTDEEGNRVLPFRKPSTPRVDDQTGFWSVLIVEEFQEAREVDAQSLDLLKDSAMRLFLNQERQKIDLYLDLNSEIANWVNKQVTLNALPATPDPQPVDPLQAFLSGGAPPTVVPTPRGVPGISIPVR